VEEKSPAGAVPEEANAADGRPTYAQVLERRFNDLTAIERQILDRRVRADTHDPLEAIAGDLGLTRERVRQLEARALGRLVGEPSPRSGLLAANPNPPDPQRSNDSAEIEVLEEAFARFQSLEPPITEAALVAAGFEPFARRETGLLLALAGRAETFGKSKLAVVEHAGRRWMVVGNRTPAKLVHTLTDAARSAGVVSDLVELWSGIEAELRPHAASDQEAADLAADVMEDLGLAEICGQYAVLGGHLTVDERLARILRANGAPMERTALLRYFGDRSERTVDNALFRSPFVRVGPDTFGLQEAGATPRPQLRDLVYEELNQHGQVAVSYLEGLAEQHGYKRTSITFYCALPDVIEEAGVLRRRGPGDPPAVPDPGLEEHCFRIVAGPHRGRWSCTVLVSRKRLYHGPQWIPTPLAVLLGIELGTRGLPINVNGVTVHASWLQSPYLWGGDLRSVLDKRGFADGERVRLVITRPGELVLEGVPVIDGSEALRTLANGAGLFDEAGAPLEIPPALAYAVGFDVDVPLPALLRRLGSRHNVALADALKLMFPEFLDQ
jgi:hypothetical protein